jgi:UDP-N-acetylglucosamine acyltransferase
VYAGVNSVGLRRRGFSNERINQILDIYRILFIKGYNTTNALKKIETEISPSEDRDEIVNFVRESVRGILKGFNSKNDD